MSCASQPCGELGSRAMVIDRAWRAVGAGLEPLSGPGGAPLTRAVKLIVLPLVIRPTLRSELAADLLDATQSARLTDLITESGERLRATAQWFTLLKKARRALGIVAGNPQDLYFQLCFELATEHGRPGADAESVAKAAVNELATASDGRTVQALRDHLDDRTRRGRIAAELAAAWAGRNLDPVSDLGAVAELAVEVLDRCADPDSDTAAEAFDALLDGGHGSLVGRALWQAADGVWGRTDLPAHLGLSEHPAPRRPEVGRGASTSALPAPLDRTVFERLFTVLQASGRREEVPSVPELVRDEVRRSCAPFGLSQESLRVVAVLGGWLAIGLDPVGGADASARVTTAHRAVNRQWQREASVLRARRMTTSEDPDGGALAALASDLRTPWVAYLRRLWVRLHGRDVRQAPLEDASAAWAVLDGVARSVMMDHRAKVRSALRALAEPRSA